MKNWRQEEGELGDQEYKEEEGPEEKKVGMKGMLWRMILEKVKSNIRFLWLQLKSYINGIPLPLPAAEPIQA